MGANQVKARAKQMRLNHGLRIKSAEFWLKLGQPMPALLELQQLPKKAQQCEWARQVFRNAVRHCARGA